jgi:DNA helicase-2/ATP-dependent DNA helicase PcrA
VGEVAFWCADNERTQAQSVAAELEQAIGVGGIPPDRLAVLVRSVADEGQAVAVALQERAVPFRIVGGGTFFERAEIRDVLAWLRLLVDPGDASAVVRALARPPIELRSIDIARCVQISRRRRLDMIAALVAATESPQLPPEARERILGFLKLHRSAAAALDSTRPDLFVHRLIDRLGLRRQQLFAAQADVVERLVNLAKLGELAAAYVRRSPQTTPREFARYIAAVAEAGLGEEEAVAQRRPEAVSVMSIDAALGLEFDHVYVLGLHSSRMPGARSRMPEPIAAELLARVTGGAADGTDSRAAHAAAMRRLLFIAMTRARRRLVLAYAASSPAGAVQQPSPFVEQARTALHAEWQERREELFGPAESLHSTFQELRSELLDSVARIGGRLGELRLDTDLDISHGAVRLLELLKLAALLQRPEGQAIAEALPDINARLVQAATPLQREIFQTSPLDELLLDAELMQRGRARAIAAREEPSLEAFLPKRGDGLVLSASDIETYRTCPLRYKFARVFRIPAEPTLNQRFGILVHQVLERFHSSSGHTLDQLVGLLDAGWRRGGFGDSDEERQLRAKAQASLTRYLERFSDESSEPTWFERSFAFTLGRHHLRGRVDRVDRLPDGGYELIDYKTGVPKTPSQLRDDVQLALYGIAARESWQLDATERSYYYVLDDTKVPVLAGGDSDWIEDTVLEVADGILAQGFEPTPSYAACSMCDYRIACPAAEK